jgi:hypothetical protein
MRLLDITPGELDELHDSGLCSLCRRNNQHGLFCIVRFNNGPACVIAIRATPIKMRDITGSDYLLQRLLAVLSRMGRYDKKSIHASSSTVNDV